VIDRGRLVQVGTPREIYENPVDTYVAQRLGQPAINLLPADILPANRLLAGTRTVGARTEHIRVTPAKDLARGRIRRVEHLGDQSHLHVAVDGHTLVALVDPDTPLGRDDAVDIALVDPLCFGADGRRLL
jgi:multiple sugar transport system ATP-binding protein